MVAGTGKAELLTVVAEEWKSMLLASLVQERDRDRQTVTHTHRDIETPIITVEYFHSRETTTI